MGGLGPLDYAINDYFQFVQIYGENVEGVG